MSIRDGRSFSSSDRIGGEPAVIISESLARHLWPAGGAIGSSLTIPLETQGAPTPQLVIHRVVGEVNNVRQSHTDSDLFDAYLALPQGAGRFAFIYLRGQRSPAWDTELRSIVTALDRDVALGAPQALDRGLEQERARPRFLAALLIVLSAFACLLALGGMYGVIVYAVRQRQREIAVRMAIGADPGSVRRLFVRQGSLVLAGGIAFGLAGAVALGQVLRSQLHGVEPAEPRVLAGAAIAFAACGLLAIWWPAWRASKIDPVLILKEE